MTGDTKARCELAMTGRVVKCTNSEVVDCIRYISKVVQKWTTDVQEKVNSFLEYLKTSSDNLKVRSMVCNTIYEDTCITFLIEAKSLPKPFETDYGSGYPCSYSYTLNLSCPYFSEFGDTFYEKRSDGFYHRVS